MFLDPASGFLTLQQASQALQDRLHALAEDARSRNDVDEAAHYTESVQHVAELTARADPHNIFEQISIRRLFTVELNDLNAHAAR